jgi:hypothetical protein
MKEKRIGEWGNNITRLLYYLEDFNDNIIDSYEYKAPVEDIYVRVNLQYQKCNNYYPFLLMFNLIYLRIRCPKTMLFIGKLQGQLMNILLLM